VLALGMPAHTVATRIPSSNISGIINPHDFNARRRPGGSPGCGRSSSRVPVHAKGRQGSCAGQRTAINASTQR
jgi:hypothetical protein